MVQPAHTKVTRDDWIAAALDALDEVAIDELRVLSLAEGLSISRSSFYWYFDDLPALQGELLSLWERNTASIVERTERTAATITTACLGVFECWADESLYDARLDLAVRDWGRRDADVAARVRVADDRRLDAVASMFASHGFEADDALVRARLLYHSQVGYYAVGVDEPMDVRVGYLPYYLQSMTGEVPTPDELASFAAFVESVEPR
ncbi:MAG: TetR/AcrR family transcriptional regulator [Actinomycetota bacterium]